MAPNNEPRFVLIDAAVATPIAIPPSALHTVAIDLDGSQSQQPDINIHQSASLSAGTASPSPVAQAPGSSQLTDATSTNMVSKKKKGITKRGTARSRPGGPKSRKSKKSTLASRTKKKGVAKGNEENVNPDQDDVDDSESDEDDGPYCVCRGPDDHTFMIACEACNEWFHGRCIGLDKDVGESLVHQFICPQCTTSSRQTQYLRTCSIEGCQRAARLYAKPDDPDAKAIPLQGEGLAQRSAFCGDEHRDAWWTLGMLQTPTKTERTAAVAAGTMKIGSESMARGEMLALLMSRLNMLDDQGHWMLLNKPFSAEETCEDWMLTPEEQRILDVSEKEREVMADDMVLCQKMLQLLEMVSQRRRAAITAKLMAEDQCGYDARLNTVGAKASFRAFVATLEGAVIFEEGELGDPISSDGCKDGAAEGEDVIMGNDDGEGAKPSTKGMCDRKRCKPHHGWHRLLVRNVRMQMRELGAAMSARIAREQEVRSAAVGKARKKAVDPGEVILASVSSSA